MKNTSTIKSKKLSQACRAWDRYLKALKNSKHQYTETYENKTKSIKT